MSRYYQPSYHGSNDYRKYKEERLNAKDTSSSLSLKSPFQQNYNPRPVMLLENKQHLQTFGQQDHIQYNFQSEGSNNEYSYQSRQHSRIRKPQIFQSTQFNIDENLSNRYGSRLSDYSRPSYPSYSQTQLTQNDTNETYQNTYRVKSNSRIINNYDTSSGMLTRNNNFQDVVIQRRKNFDYVVRKDATNQQSYKNYNYSSQINRSNHQTSQTDNFVVEHKSIQLKMPDEELSRSKIEKRNYLNTTQQKTDNITSYQTRNQLIRQRLNLNSITDSRSSSILRSNLKLSHQQDQYPNPPQRISKYTPQTHTTPQKTQLTPKADRDLSEKRRKSLIEKSQILKQKLNKLNTSSTKLQANQEKQEDKMKSNTQNQSQNIISQGYTPPKRYLPTQLQSNCQNQQPTDRSLSKKLNFDVNVKEPQKSQNCDTVLQESNRNYSRNYVKTYQRQTLQDPTAKDQNPFRNNKFNNIQSNDGALKKIHELNQRINSRLQSILKNYG